MMDGRTVSLTTAFFKRSTGIYILLLLLLPLSCNPYSTKDSLGPPYPFLEDAGGFRPEGRYRFTPSVRFYRRGLVGEIIFQKGKQNRHYFMLRVAGVKQNYAIRVRQYEGDVVSVAGGIELYSRRCYIFGKRDWEERLWPMERWDCDHIVFRMRPADDFETTGAWVGYSDERTKQSDWFQLKRIDPMVPENPDSHKKTPPVFAGQILSGMDATRVIVYGYHAGKILKKNQKLTVTTPDGKIAGRLSVESRPGDFLICKWQEPIISDGDPNAAIGLIAYTYDRETSPGIFSF